MFTPAFEAASMMADTVSGLVVTVTVFVTRHPVGFADFPLE
jgi:hypothetical protein